MDACMERKILAVLLDCGDTLVDEGTEVKDETGVVLQARLIPGAADLVRGLKERGYRLGLVADGPAGTFHNILGRYHLLPLFDALAISELVGFEKPHPAMFTSALCQLGLHEAQYRQVIMVGNHLARDVKGANALGLISVWLDWSPRRAKVPSDLSEQPCHIIHHPIELINLIPAIEKSLL
jgi:putative hydrolase of the HAD superfamily